MGLDIKKSLVGSLLRWPAGIRECVPLLGWGDCLSGPLSVVIPIINTMYEEGKVIGISSVVRELRFMGPEENQINIDFMTRLLEECLEVKKPTAYLKQYTDEIVNELVSNQVRDMIMSVGASVHDEHVSPERLVDQLETCLVDIRNSMSTDEEIKVDGACDDSMAEFDRFVESGESPLIKTGLYGLDRIINGFAKGSYVLISAMSGVGKSAIATSMLIQQAQKGTKGAFISLEMDSMALNRRLVQQISGFDQGKYMRTRTFTDFLGSGDEVIEDHDAARLYLGEAHKILKDYDIRTACPKNMSISNIKAICRKMVSEGVEILTIDYLQLIAGNTSLGREREIADVSNQLRLLAIELDCPILVCAQQGPKALENGPASEYVRESKQPKFDAFVTILIDNDSKGQRKNRIIVDKHRCGSTGSFDIEFNGDFISFVSAVDTNVEVF